MTTLSHVQDVCKLIPRYLNLLLGRAIFYLFIFFKFAVTRFQLEKSIWNVKIYR